MNGPVRPVIGIRILCFGVLQSLLIIQIRSFPPRYGWKPRKEKNLLGEIFAFSPVDYIGIEFGGTVGDRKVSALGVSNTAENGAGITALVKGGAQSFGSFCRLIDAGLGDRLQETDFMNIIRSIRVFLGDGLAYAFCEESIQKRFKSIDMLICAR